MIDVLRRGLALAALLAVLVPGVLAGQMALAQESSPESAAPDPKLVVAKLDGVEITRQDVLDSARNLPAEVQQNIDRLFPHLLDRLIFLKLIAAKGRAEGLAEDPDVKKILLQYEDNAIREVFFKRVVTAKVTEEAIKAKYDEELKSLEPTREIRASHILVQTELEAKAILGRLQAGADFAALAKSLSIDKTSGKDGGDLGWFTRDVMIKEFGDAAFAMKKGELSAAPVKSQFGYHIIHLVDERMQPPPSLDERREDIRIALTEEARREVEKELRDKAAIEIIDAAGGVKAAQ